VRHDRCECENKHERDAAYHEHGRRNGRSVLQLREDQNGQPVVDLGLTQPQVVKVTFEPLYMFEGSRHSLKRQFA